MLGYSHETCDGVHKMISTWLYACTAWFILEKRKKRTIWTWPLNNLKKTMTFLCANGSKSF